MNDTYSAAVQAIAHTGWGRLGFFQTGQAARVAQTVDTLAARGAAVLPGPAEVFNALNLTPPDKVRAVILGQDPYPTPGHAHGLAFSVTGRGQSLPMSLRTVFEALQRDTGLITPVHGNLTAWAKRGVLLLNTVLTVEAGKAHAHKALGWQELAGEVLGVLNAQQQPVVFMLWGKPAQAAGKALDRQRHCIIETAHPSPLARGKGALHRFVEAQPFRKANEWLAAHGLTGLDWSLPE